MKLDRSAYAGRTLETATSQQRTELSQQLSRATDSNSRVGLDLNSKEVGSTVAPKPAFKGRTQANSLDTAGTVYTIRPIPPR